MLRPSTSLENRSVVVEATKTSKDPLALYAKPMRIGSFVLSALVASQILVPLAGRVANDIIQKSLLVCVGAVATHLLFTFSVKKFFKFRLRQDSDAFVQFDHWRVSDVGIERHFKSHIEVLSPNCVRAVNVDSKYVEVTYRSGVQEKLDRNGFANDRELNVAVELLSEAAAGNLRGFTPVELGDTIEIESHYDRKMLKTLKTHSGESRQRWNDAVARITFIGVHFLLYNVLDSLVNGAGPKSSIFAVGLFLLPELSMLFLTDGDVVSTRCLRIGTRGFSFGQRLNDAYSEVISRWEDLQDVVETDQGLVLKFVSRQQAALIPKSAVSLQRYQDVIRRISQLADRPELLDLCR